MPESLSRPILDSGPAPSAAEVDSLLELAIDRALAAASGQVGMFLSGGVDSTLLLAMLAPRAEVRAVTVAGCHDHPDLLAALRIADEWGIPHRHAVPEVGEQLEAEEHIRRTRATPKPGDAGVYLACRLAAEAGIDTVLATDGIDELTGGYWWHAHPSDRFASQAEAFEHFWRAVWPDHLEPLCLSAADCGLSVLFPYLDDGFVARMTCIPLQERAPQGRPKAWWKGYARRWVPEWVVERPKIGFVNALATGGFRAERR